MKKIFVFALILLFPICVFTQENKAREIKRINLYVKQLTSYVERNPKSFEVFADVSQTEKSKWSRFKSEKALTKFREKTETYKIAYVWRRNKKVVAANLTLFSQSGDWAHYILYRFREDGTLAKIEADLRTFYGNISVQRNYYFGKNARLLRQTTQYRDLHTNKPKNPTEGFMNQKVYIFKKTSRLPFARLLKI